VRGGTLLENSVLPGAAGVNRAGHCPSSFIAMFRRALGTTPSQYFAGER
jgi:hypothetical protein